MPTEYQFFVEDPDSDEYYDLSNKGSGDPEAVLNGHFSIELDEIEVVVCEACYPKPEEVSIDSDDILDRLGDAEISFPDLTKEQEKDLEVRLSYQLQQWIRDHHLRFEYFHDTKNKEVITLPKPEHVDNIE